MSEELPEGWCDAPLLECCEIIRGVSYAKGEAKTQPANGLIPLLRANNIAEELIFHDLQYVPNSRVNSHQMLRAGDVIVAMSSGSKAVVGKGAQFRGDWVGTFGAFCGVLRLTSQIEPRYFGLFFRTRKYRHAISEAAAGTNINNLKREYFEALSLPLPPLAEQQRIVPKVEALLARVNAARQRLAKVPAILKRFRQSVLAAACSGWLTQDWRDEHPDVEAASTLLNSIRHERRRQWESKHTKKRYAQPEPPDGDLGQLDDRWCWVSAKEVVEQDADIRYGIVQPGPPLEEGVPYVRGIDIQNGQILISQLLKTSPQIAEQYRGSTLRKGDVLLGIIRHLKVAVVPKALDGGNMARTTARLRPSALVTTAYLARALESPFCQSWLKSKYRGGTDMPKVNIEDVVELPIPVPPMSEQHEIVRRVDALFRLADAIEKRVAAATVRADKLMQAILAKAFRGELVPTEAELARREGRDYEPASVLLERIRAERQAKEAPSKGVRKARRRAKGAH
jgi:type I restriction enzyme S subunit